MVDARRRHLGVTAARARDQRLSSALGRLAFTGVITQQQYEAGQRFGEVYHRHHVLTGLPLPSPSSVAGLMATQGSSVARVDRPTTTLSEGSVAATMTRCRCWPGVIRTADRCLAGLLVGWSIASSVSMRMRQDLPSTIVRAFATPSMKLGICSGCSIPREQAAAGRT